MTPPAGGGPSDRPPLSAREREVLEAIVSHYIQTGVPASSRAISKVNSEQLSPASLRSIMVELEESGYITHPHTSAGRVPTDLGYRHYVDTLDTRHGLSRIERRQLSETLTATGGIDSLIARCCKLLSAASNQVSVGTAPDIHSTAFRHVEFVKLAENRVLVVFITASGLVQQQIIAANITESQAELQRYANYLNAELAGRTLTDVRSTLASMMKQERDTYDVLARRAAQLGAQYFTSDTEVSRSLYVDGTEHLLDRPDLSDFDRMKSLIAALEDKSRIIQILDRCLIHEGVTTTIGSENDQPELAGLSLVVASYGMDEQPMGMLGIIGPTRMEYERAMALVDYVAELLGSVLAQTKR